MAQQPTVVRISPMQGSQKHILLDYIGPWSINIIRGPMPSSFSALISDTVEGITKFDNYPNPVRIGISAPDVNNRTVEANLLNWYITSVTPHSPGIWRLEMQDKFWTCREKLLEKSFNQELAANQITTFREESLFAGNEWTCYNAAKFIITFFGLKFKDLPQTQFDQSLKKVLLPKNLSDNEGGGFIGMTWDAAIVAALDRIGCDPVMLPNGRCTIADRSTNLTADLDTFNMYGGAIDKEKFRGKPKFAIIKFPRRVERFVRLEDFDPRATGTQDEDDISFANVVPKLDPADDEPGWELLFDQVEEHFPNFVTIKYLRKHYMNDVIYPWEEDPNNPNRDNDRASVNLNVKQFFRIAFRPDLLTDQGAAGMADLKFGMLGINGKTKSDKCVFMDATRLRLMHSQEQGFALSADTRFTFFDQINLQSPSPWTPVAFYDQNGEIIVMLQPDTNRSTTLRVIRWVPGKFDQDMNYGDVFDIATDGTAKMRGLKELELTDEWTCYIFYHALLVEPRIDLGFTTRLEEFKFSMFPDGDIESIDIVVGDLTANYTNDRTPFGQGDVPTTMDLQFINLPECLQRATDETDKLKGLFATGNAGFAQTAGIGAIKHGKWVAGNIFSMMIRGGADQPHTITCQWIAKPEPGAFISGPRVDGTPTQVLG